MLHRGVALARTLTLSLLLLVVILLASHSTSAQGDPEPRTVHNACAGNCVADVIFLHAGMGDTQARNFYHAWFGSYYELTGCGDPAWKTDLLFLLDIIGDAVGAPGAPTMQCWQGLAAQASLCSSDCSGYFIPDARWGPNVRLVLNQSSPGYAEVTLDNQYNLNKLPELQPNAYSRQFHLLTTLSYEGGEALLVNDTPMPSLSFPNWITRGGLSDCSNAYGFESARCQILASFDTPSVVSTPVEFLDGALYDLTSQVSDLSDANGSFSQQGYVRLLSDGDSLTINQGPYAGYKLVKTHYLGSGTHRVELTPWDASAGPVSFTNHECNTWLSTCWISGPRYDADTYIYALQGPANQRLAGSYTVKIVADIPHDKDFADNRAEYTYDASAVQDQGAGGTGGTGSGGSGTGGTDQTVHVQDLYILDITGPSVHTASFGPDVPGVMYRLSVPPQLRLLYLRLVSVDGGSYSMFVRRGSIPVPDYPVIHDEYHCWAQSDVGYSDGCPFANPVPGDYYIFISRWQGSGSVRLEIEYTFQPPTPTPTPAPPTPTPGPSPTPVPTATPEPGTFGDSTAIFTESEPNDSHATANPWALGGSFVGTLGTRGDRDILLLSFTQPGIYTITATDVTPDLKIKLTLLRYGSGNWLAASLAEAKGASVDLTIDASAGEQYYLIVHIAALSPATSAPYRLYLSGFIPDPDEPNDDRQTATPWDLTSGPVSGYFWDRITGRHDYFGFVAPPGVGPITFSLTNPAPELRIRMAVLNRRGLTVTSVPWSVAGQPATLSAVLEPGQSYTIKLESMNNRASIVPYTLSVVFEGPPDGSSGGGGGSSGTLGGDTQPQASPTAETARERK